MASRSKSSTKTGGRKKGTPNKRSLFLSDYFEKLGLDVPAEICRILNMQLPDDPLELAGLTPFTMPLTNKEKALILVELLSYLYPKRKPIDTPTSDQDDKRKIIYDTQWGE